MRPKEQRWDEREKGAIERRPVPQKKAILQILILRPIRGPVLGSTPINAILSAIPADVVAEKSVVIDVDGKESCHHEEALATLPHLKVAGISEEITPK